MNYLAAIVFEVWFHVQINTNVILEECLENRKWHPYKENTEKFRTKRFSRFVLQNNVTSTVIMQIKLGIPRI